MSFWRTCSATSASEPAPRSSSSSERKWTWKRTSPSSSSSLASSRAVRGVGQLVGLLERVRDDRALVLLAVPRALDPQAPREGVELRDRLGRVVFGGVTRASLRTLGRFVCATRPRRSAADRACSLHCGSARSRRHCRPPPPGAALRLTHSASTHGPPLRHHGSCCRRLPSPPPPLSSPVLLQALAGRRRGDGPASLRLRAEPPSLASADARYRAAADPFAGPVASAHRRAHVCRVYWAPRRVPEAVGHPRVRPRSARRTCPRNGSAGARARRTCPRNGSAGARPMTPADRQRGPSARSRNGAGTSRRSRPAAPAPPAAGGTGTR